MGWQLVADFGVALVESMHTFDFGSPRAEQHRVGQHVSVVPSLLVRALVGLAPFLPPFWPALPPLLEPFSKLLDLPPFPPPLEGQSRAKWP